MFSAPLLWAAAAAAQPAPAPVEPAPAEPAPAEPAPVEPALDPGEPPITDIEPEDGVVIGDGGGAVVQSIAQRVGLNVFGDATFAVDSEAEPHSGFELGALGVIMNAELTEHLSAINEVAFEFIPEADGVAAPVADIERLQLQYIGTALEIAAGRLHTDLGYWNTAYHHGRWLQLPIERPHAVQFEDDDGMLPIHSVGVQAAYRARVGTGAVRVVAAVSNGRGRIEDDVLTLADTNEMKAILVKVETVDLGRRDLHAGASALVDRIAPYPGRAQHPASAITELIGNAFVAYRGPSLTAIAEAYVVSHGVAGARWTTLAGFGLVGWDTGRLVPFAQVEVRRAPDDVDPFYSPGFDPAAPDPAAVSEVAHDLVEGTVGVRVDLADWSVIKVAAEVERVAGTTAARGLVNWSFGI